MFFRVILPVVILSLQVLLLVVSVRWIRKHLPGRRWVLILTCVLFLIFDGAAIYMFTRYPSLTNFSDWVIYSFIYPYFIWHAATLFLSLLALLFSLMKFFLWVIRRLLSLISPLRRKAHEFLRRPEVEAFNASRRVFLRQSAYGVTGVAFAGSTYGLLVGRNAYEITHVQIPIENLPPSLSGFTIALASDIHSSGFMQKEEMERYASVINSLHADMIVVDGDFVTGQLEEVYPFAEAFSSLKAPYGVFGVMGNHDFYNRDPDRVAREVDDCGIRLLRDDKAIIEKNGAQLYLIGVDDIGRATGATVKMNTAIGYAPLQIPKILLCHRPYYLPEAAARGIDLVLSGHTHGGQIVLGRIGNTVIAPASFASPYIAGIYRQDGTQMYVSRGIGTVGFPMRINCPPEITKIEIVPSVS